MVQRVGSVPIVGYGYGKPVWPRIRACMACKRSSVRARSAPFGRVAANARYAIDQYLEHYHGERPHQGMGIGHRAARCGNTAGGIMQVPPAARRTTSFLRAEGGMTYVGRVFAPNALRKTSSTVWGPASA